MSERLLFSSPCIILVSHVFFNTSQKQGKPASQQAFLSFFYNKVSQLEVQLHIYTDLQWQACLSKALSS